MGMGTIAHASASADQRSGSGFIQIQIYFTFWRIIDFFSRGLAYLLLTDFFILRAGYSNNSRRHTAFAGSPRLRPSSCAPNKRR